jgi:hypothetical protein
VVHFVRHFIGRGVERAGAASKGGTMVQRHRVKISATLDPELVASVDAYVREHPESNRGKILDEALMLWLAQEQERAMEEQYAATDDIPEDELRQWYAVLAANAQTMLRRDPDA